MSFLVRQIVEQEIAKVSQQKEVSSAETKGSKNQEAEQGRKVGEQKL